MFVVKNLVAGYGSTQVLNGMDLKLEESKVVALLGRNGVGKTTFLKSLMGIVPATKGNVFYGDRDVARMKTFEIARLGIGYVPQGRGIFVRLTVKENLEIGLRARSTANGNIPQYIFEKFPILAERGDQLAGTLSGGQQQQLAISRALCSEPKVLLLDEPSEGIQPNIVQEIGVFVRDLAEQRGISVLIVEQNLELVQNTCDHFNIMVKGEIVHSGSNRELSNEEMLKEHLSV